MELPIVPLVAILGVMGLLGCGGDETPSSGDTQGTSTQSQDSDQSQKSEASPQEASGGSDAPEASSGDKPSEAEVAEDFLAIAKQALNDEFPEDYAGEVAQSFVDNIYDKVSAKTLNAIVDKEIWEMDKHDVATYGQAGAVRGEKLGD